MIRKHDWDSAVDAWVEAERERLGGPPSANEITAYKRGDLQPAAAERVRALLVYYPELMPYSIGELSELDVARDRAALRTRIAAAQRHPLRRVAAIAACVTIALLAGLLIESRSEIERFSRQHREPYVHQSRYELRNILTRGAGSDQTTYELRAGEERYLLAPTLSHEYDYSGYRIDIVQLTPAGPKTVWSIAGVTPSDGAFELSVPHELLSPGTFRIEVSGLESGRAQLLESFTIRIAPSR